MGIVSGGVDGRSRACVEGRMDGGCVDGRMGSCPGIDGRMGGGGIDDRMGGVGGKVEQRDTLRQRQQGEPIVVLEWVLDL